MPTALAIAPELAHEPSILSAHDRLLALCDPGSLQLIRSRVASPVLGDRAVGGDGVVAGAGRVDGRPVFCYAQDASFLGGSLGEAHADSIVRVLELAERAKAPIVGFVESGGARMQEGTDALGGYGRIFRSTVRLAGRVPRISIVSGLSAGGGAYAPALTDFVIMSGSSSMFLTGPRVVKEALGEDVTAEELGGPAVHERTGVCHLVAEDHVEAAGLARRLLGFGGTGHPDVSPPDGPDPETIVPSDTRKVYDVRDVVRAIADGDSFLELAPRWAKNMTIGMARIDGHAVAIVANQPRHLGGVIDAAASEKAAWMVGRAERLRLPLVVLVDTPGFMPGTRQEQAGVIRHGAGLLEAFAAASVPKVTVVLRKAFGGAFITMNSKDLGADLVLGWPQAQIGVMGAEPAVGIIHRRALAVATDPENERARLAGLYAEEHLSASVAAARGAVDETVEPGSTRGRLSGVLHALAPARERTS
ncbi:MAG: carboxyl transferase [Solirubrobacterales bacterium]|nr:carboxyl transferase [Solirubrobacterales bacterium]